MIFVVLDLALAKPFFGKTFFWSAFQSGPTNMYKRRRFVSVLNGFPFNWTTSIRVLWHLRNESYKSSKHFATLEIQSQFEGADGPPETCRSHTVHLRRYSPGCPGVLQILQSYDWMEHMLAWECWQVFFPMSNSWHPFRFRRRLVQKFHVYQKCRY